MEEHIYLDHNASCPIAPRVAEAMEPFLRSHFGNPASKHWAGRGPNEAVKKARSQVARLLGCSPKEVVFTSGGTESNNMAIKGVFYKLRERGRHIVTCQVEHPAVLNPCLFLELEHDADVTILDVDSSGRVSAEDVARALRPDTILVSIMHANNEVGTVQPIEEIAAVTGERGVLFHCDAAQSVGKLPARVDEVGVDLLSIAAHKFYGPKGVGALFVRKDTPLEPLMHGAGHEYGRRAGTENVILQVGLGAAAELAMDLTWTFKARSLRERLWHGLETLFPGTITRNGPEGGCLPNTLNVCIHNRVGAEVLEAIPTVAASTGSACHDGVVRLSPVLDAMGVSREVGMGALRFSLGRGTTDAEIDRVIELLKPVAAEEGGAR